MAEYQVREEKRAALETTVDGWLRLEGIRHIEVVRVMANRKTSKITDSEIDSDELEALETGEAVLERVLEVCDGLGGKMALRLRFDDYDKPNGTPDRQKAFTLVRVREPSTKSQGSNAATEQLATSLATAFDAQASRVEDRDARFSDMMSTLMMRGDEQSERRLSEHSTFQMEIMRLQSEISRRDMQIALMENQTAIPAEVWIELAKAGIPVVGDLVGVVKSAVSAWGSSFTPIQAPATPKAPAAPAPAAK